MKSLRKVSVAAIIATGLIFTTASSAQAVTVWPGTPASHGSFTRQGIDYVPVFIGSTHAAAGTGATCVGHSDYYKRRQALCPWCQWYYGWFVHCTQV